MREFVIIGDIGISLHHQADGIQEKTKNVDHKIELINRLKSKDFSQQKGDKKKQRGSEGNVIKVWLLLSYVIHPKTDVQYRVKYHKIWIDLIENTFSPFQKMHLV